ncbi:response regulator [Sagittula sp. NFXS13]|uniref:Two-component system chemotaxis response regulator CheY n=1 Tax=Sagittula marina TaxID=943940 RepID=A0A7W6DSS9_9RHOB|nr:two-component system chemotaxis response regulator CheY [Sagittula marina]
MTKTILAIDDSASVRLMVKMTLTGAGYKVVEAVDGQNGLDQARTCNPDAVLTDQNMPRLDGIGFIRKFRQMPESAGVPVVFISTESDAGIVQQARAAGATGWIVKPFDQAKLLAVVSKMVKA